MLRTPVDPPTACQMFNSRFSRRDNMRWKCRRSDEEERAGRTIYGWKKRIWDESVGLTPGEFSGRKGPYESSRSRRKKELQDELWTSTKQEHVYGGGGKGGGGGTGGGCEDRGKRRSGAKARKEIQGATSPCWRSGGRDQRRQRATLMELLCSKCRITGSVR